MFLCRVAGTASVCPHYGKERIKVCWLMQPEQIGAKRLGNKRRVPSPLERAHSASVTGGSPSSVWRAVF